MFQRQLHTVRQTTFAECFFKAKLDAGRRYFPVRHQQRWNNNNAFIRRGTAEIAHSPGQQISDDVNPQSLPAFRLVVWATIDRVLDH